MGFQEFLPCGPELEVVLSLDTRTKKPSSGLMEPSSNAVETSSPSFLSWSPRGLAANFRPEPRNPNPFVTLNNQLLSNRASLQILIG